MRPLLLVLALFSLALGACSGDEFADEANYTPQSEWRFVDAGDKGTEESDGEPSVAEAGGEAQPNRRPTLAPTFTLRPGVMAISTPRPSGGEGEKDVTAPGTIAATPKLEGGGQAPEPTAVGTPTVTNTPGPPTRTPTPTVTPSVTPIPDAASAPRFPETPVQPFDRTIFIQTLGLIDDSMRSFDENWLLILRDERDRNRGDCGSFLGWFTLWVTQAPFFTDVPPAWNDLVYNYRAFLADAVYYSSPIQRQCPGVTTDLRVGTELAIDFFSTAYARSSELLRQAQEMP